MGFGWEVGGWVELFSGLEIDRLGKVNFINYLYKSLFVLFVWLRSYMYKENEEMEEILIMFFFF